MQAKAIGFMDDLWSFNTTSMWWTFLGGSNSTFPLNQYHYNGIKGVPSPLNWPQARAASAMWQVDDTIYIFGGQVNYNVCKSLKKFPTNSHKKMFLHHQIQKKNVFSPSQQQIHIKKNVSSPPPNDIKKYFQQLNFPVTNELWAYKDSTWTWLSGTESSNFEHLDPHYVHFGQYSNESQIGERAGAATIEHEGNLWQFGGFGYIDALSKFSRLLS
jgi:hypothetical protein